MRVTQSPSLLALNTFGVAASAGLLIAIESEEDILSLPMFEPARDIILGGGSNVLFVDDVPGTVLLNRIGGIELIEQDEDSARIEVGAGVNWHDVVAWSLRQDLSGLENLALIPGMAGAAPIQNIGAYGVELASVLETVTAWDWQTSTWAVLSKEQCALGYRDSRFKMPPTDRYFITSIRLRLNKQFDPQLNYSGLREELHEVGIKNPRAKDVYAAIIRLRQRKLPDPTVSGNAGSFFKNPVVSLDMLESLLGRFPALPNWGLGQSQAKISAAWLIDQCQLKGYRSGGAAVSTRHALVLINEEAASGAAIWRLAQHVQQQVRLRFDIMLEPEARIYLQPSQP